MRELKDATGRERVRIQRMFAERTISISELRKRISDVFSAEGPVAVLNKNRTVGYIVRADVYEEMVLLIERLSPTDSRQFRPNKGLLEQIKRDNAQWLDSVSVEELEQSEFEEV